MKNILTVLLLIFSLLSLAQKTNRTHTFRVVDWTIIIPEDFTIMDSASDAALNQKGVKDMEDANGIKVDASATRTLISASKPPHNYFNSTITPYDPVKDGNYDSTCAAVADVVYRTFTTKIPAAKLDTFSRETTIDNLTFHRFEVKATVNSQVIFNLVVLTKYYRGFDFGITYLYQDEKSRDEIERMLAASKFKK
ncbi:MAG TPA: hypothetical protein VMI35_03830 [Puia sp.]|nr:hypothetical protein [Puia sp.]